MKISKKDILSIKAGTSMKFKFDNYENLKSTQVYAYQLSNSSDRPQNVERYKCSYCKEEMSLTIEAVRK